MNERIDRLYSEARKNWRSLDKNTTDLTQQQVNALKWALEVVFTNPLEKPMKLISNNLILNVRTERYIYEVFVGFTKDRYLVLILDTNEIAFAPDVDYEVALRITTAFNMWCELVRDDVFKDHYLAKIRH